MEVLGLIASAQHTPHGPDPRDTHPDIEKRLLNYFYSGFPQFLPPHIGHLPPFPAFQKKYINPGTKKNIKSIISTIQFTPFVGATNCLQFRQYACFVMLVYLLIVSYKQSSSFIFVQNFDL